MSSEFRLLKRFPFLQTVPDRVFYRLLKTLLPLSKPHHVPSGPGPGPGSNGPIPAIRMAPGMFQTIYLNSSGSVFVMGSGNQGQLGDGESGRKTFSSVPVHVKLPGPMGLVGSGMGTCWAVSADGRHAYAWGTNKRGQLGIGKSHVKEARSPVEMDFHLPPGVTIVQLADGLKSGLVLLSNGQVMAWGNNKFGQGGLDPHKFGKYLYTPHLVPGLSGVKQLVAGDNYTLALKTDGTVWAWGQNHHGELGPNGPTPGARRAHSFKPVEVTGLPPIESLQAGGRNGVALDQNGHLWEWGRNEFGELGDGGVDHADGAHPTPSMVQGLPPIVSFDSEGPTVVAADAQGNVYCWGFDKYGAVGDGKTINTGVPAHVLTIPTSPLSGGPSVQVAAAHRSIYAFNVVTGQTYAWGQNNEGQIGLPPDKGANPNPVDITSLVAPTLSAACFHEGTRLRTPKGERRVETLSVGDLVVTASGGVRPIRWIGHAEIDCHRQANRAAVLPVRVAAGAFGPNCPSRDLLLSPGHAVCVDVLGEVLVPIAVLADGEAVRQIEVGEASYWHVELDTHDILLAESLGCESYLDVGNRGFFASGTVHRLRATPDHRMDDRGDVCRPFVDEGPLVHAALAYLRARFGRRGRLAGRPSRAA